MSTNFDLYCWI